MEKIRLVDLLSLIADKKLKDGQMVLIDRECYRFEKNKERFYVPNNINTYRMINTFDMNLVCYILKDYVEEED